LIYGPGVKGNFARLMALARKPWPLPLGLCRNRRSLLARRNLIDAVHFAVVSPATKGETYVVADPAPLTLAEIVTALRAGEGRGPGLLPVPPSLMALAAGALGRAEEWQRLGGTQVADPSKLIEAGWKPALDTRASLAALARETRD
jgi:nucleoside-diphosphate-sugar epimerase